MCSLLRCGRGWCQWRYSLDLSIEFDGGRLVSSDDCGLAAGTCRLAKYQVRVDIRMLLLDVISVLVGTAPFGATINTRTGIVLRSVMTINALQLCILFAAFFPQVWALEYFTHASRSPWRQR